MYQPMQVVSSTPAYAEDRSAVEAVYAVGHWLLSEERFVDAATIFRLMMRTAPTDERGWLALGTCHEKLGQHEVALEVFGGGAVAAEPSARCHLARFRVLWEHNRWDEADEAIAAAAECAEQLDDETLVSLVHAERRARP